MSVVCRVVRTMNAPVRATAHWRRIRIGSPPLSSLPLSLPSLGCVLPLLPSLLLSLCAALCLSCRCSSLSCPLSSSAVSCASVLLSFVPAGQAHTARRRRADAVHEEEGVAAGCLACTWTRGAQRRRRTIGLRFPSLSSRHDAHSRFFAQRSFR